MSSVDAAELIAWRGLHARLDQLACEVLKAHGDTAPRDLINLQHKLAELGRPPFGAKQTSPTEETH